MRRASNSSNSRHGQVFIFFLMLTTVSLLLVVSLLTLQSRVYHNATNIKRGVDAANLADAGLDQALAKFRASPSFTGETVSIGNGSFTTSITSGATSNERYINVSATVQGITRKAKVKISTSPNGTAVAFNYAMQTGTNGFTFGNNAQLIGSAYSNGAITGSAGSIITGDAYAVTTITGVTVQGTKYTNQQPEPLPPFDASFWKSKAQEGGTYTGNLTPANGSSIGPLFITGNLTLGNNINITIKGPVYVQGSIVLGNAPVLTADNSLGSAGSMLVTEQAINLGNTITINNNASGGYLLLASTSTSGITIGNNAVAINGPVYAPNGNITLGNNTRGVAFTAKGIVLGNNAIIEYEEGLANAGFGHGPAGTWVVSKGTYQEVE